MKKHTVCRLCSSCCPVEVEIEGNRLVAMDLIYTNTLSLP